MPRAVFAKVRFVDLFADRQGGAKFAEPVRPTTASPLPAPLATAPPKPPPPLAARPPAVARPAVSPVRELLERTLSAERRVDTLLAAAATGKTFSPGELLALQATVFRYSQAVEVVSRATDKLVGAVKQTMSTQV